MTKQSNHKNFGLIFDELRHIYLVLVCLFSVFAPIYAKGDCPDQGKRLSAQEYCRLYAAEAQRQQKLYGVPASITLAQGMFESAYGASYLAVKANNHFGIKAYHGWSGPVVKCDDDKSKEPFCKFNSVKDGYEYHSKFLRNSTRYAPLFKLKVTDYKGWAKGLRQCGYATNPKYPQMLIDIIERYHLDAYDKGTAVAATSTSTSSKDTKTSSSTKTSTSGSKTNSTSKITLRPYVGHKLYSTANRKGLKYTVALKNDNLFAISKEYKISVSKLRAWNDFPRIYTLKEGERVYLQPKRRKADKLHPVHTVQKGESLHSISQQYGVKVKSIVKRNKLESANVKAGQTLKLR